MLEAEESLKNLARMKERWLPTIDMKNVNNSNYSNQYSHNVAVSTHFIDEDHLVGIKENRMQLTKLLNFEEPQLSVISVCGMGGVGKTTLVTNVFKREKHKFDSHAWISISQTYIIENLLHNLISELCRNEEGLPIDTTNMNIQRLKETLHNLLKEKKYLIVLDDIWDAKAFLDISDVLVGNHQGSKIVITSRMAEVGNLAPASNRLKVKPLSKTDSWYLFCTKAFHLEKNHECPSSLKKWATEIVLKCDGLPLALVSIGVMLSMFEKAEVEWKWLFDQLSWQLDNNPSLDPLKNILNLSFNNPPSYLKCCFLYCGLFPEDSLLARKKLTRLWVAEGFIEQKGRSTLEEVADGYFMELIHRNMLQVARRSYSGKVKMCKMHDTLRELVNSLCRKENFGLLHEDNKLENVNSSTRRISVIKLSKKIKYDVCLPKLRTFLFVDDNVPSSLLLSMIFDKSRYLTVLDLEGLPIKTIPNSIGDLFNLHYLGLRKTKVKFVPKTIKKLHNLQTLGLWHSKVQKPPDSISELKVLRHLFAEVQIDSTYSSFRISTAICLPKGAFYLKDLPTLQTVESNAMVVRKLGNLTQLRSFRIWNVKENHSVDLCKSLSKMSYLSSLSINASNENELLQLKGLNLNMSQIQKLELYGRLQEKILESPLFQISGEGIQRLWLGWSQLQNDPLPSLSHCKNLTCLYLKKAYEGHQLIFQAGWFPKLKSLVLGLMPNLNQVEMKHGTMVSLEEVYLLRLQQLMEIPMGIKHLLSLKRMSCRDMPVDFGGLVKGTHQLFHFTCLVR